jgi:hypothetical protein
MRDDPSAQARRLLRLLLVWRCLLSADPGGTAERFCSPALLQIVSPGVQVQMSDAGLAPHLGHYACTRHLNQGCRASSPDTRHDLSRHGRSVHQEHQDQADADPVGADDHLSALRDPAAFLVVLRLVDFPSCIAFAENVERPLVREWQAVRPVTPGTVLSRSWLSLSLRGSGRLDTRLDTPPISFRHHPDSRIARRGHSRDAIQDSAMQLP